MAELRMPILGADMRSGTLVEWRKRPGDRISRGEIIAEVETDKGNIEIEVFESGVIDRLLVEPGTEVPVGTPLALLRGEEAAAAEPPRAEETGGPSPPKAPPPRPRASPLARRLATERGIALASLQGTGPGGAITRADVERAAPSSAPPMQGRPRPDRSARMREAIAAAMARSKREIPHYYVASTIDLERTTRWLRARNQEHPIAERILPAAVLLKAVALSLREVPQLNARWQGTTAAPSGAVHLGVAIALRGGGLVAPALLDAETLSVPELMRALRDLSSRARSGKLRSSELSLATATVTSLGDQGAQEVLGIIYPPQVALIGLGRIMERPWCVDGRVVARPTVRASLAADHRVSDGHEGSRLLAALDRHLQRPEDL